MSELAKQTASARALDAALAPRPLTDQQRKLLFALARKRGFDLDDLRAMTPTGSVSALSTTKAAALIDRLKGEADAAGSKPKPRKRTRRRTQEGVVPLITPAQQTRIATIVVHTLHWTAEGFDGWLRSQFHVDGFSKLANADTARRVIFALERIAAWRATRSPQRNG